MKAKDHLRNESKLIFDEIEIYNRTLNNIKVSLKELFIDCFSFIQVCENVVELSTLT